MPEMQILLACHHVQALVEIIRLFAVERRRKVARGVQRGPVRAHEQAGRHVVAQAHYFCAVVVHEQALLREKVENGLHFVVIETFARIGIERHVKALVDFLHLFQSGLFEAVEDGKRFFVAVFYLLEPGARLVVQHGVFLRFLVEFHVYIHKRTHSALFYILVVTPQFVSHYKFAELRAPVAQMVYSHRVIPRLFVQAVERRAQNRVQQMPYMERFGDIHGRVVYAHRLAPAYIAVSVIFARGQHLFQHVFGIGLLVEGKVDERTRGLRLFQKVVTAYPAHNFLCKLRGILPRRLCQTETGQRIVAVRLIPGRNYLRHYLFAFYPFDYNSIRQKFFVIHSIPALPGLLFLSSRPTR